MFFWRTLSRTLKFYISAFIMIVFAALALIVLYLYNSELRSDKYNSLIINAAVRYNVDPNLIKAVIWKESTFSPLTIGSKQERGLMQIMEKNAVQDWANYYGCAVPPSGILYLPEVNINIGSWYLAKCLEHWTKYKDNLMLGLAEYNAGYKNAKEWAPKNPNDDVMGRIKFPSTKRYVKAILKKYGSWKESKSRLEQ